MSGELGEGALSEVAPRDEVQLSPGDGSDACWMVAAVSDQAGTRPRVMAVEAHSFAKQPREASQVRLNRLPVGVEPN
jgi:hypothetical protein